MWCAPSIFAWLVVAAVRWLLFVVWIGWVRQSAHQLGLVLHVAFIAQCVVTPVIDRKKAALTAKAVGCFLGR